MIVTMPANPTLRALAVVTLWGLNFVVIYAGLRDIPPLLFAAIRFTAILPAVFFVPRPAVPWSRLAAVGVLMSAGQFGLLYSSLAAGMPAGLASLVLQAMVLITICFAVIALRELPSRRQLIGVSIGAVGLGVVAVGRQSSTPLFALLLALLAAASWAGGNVVARRLGNVSGLGVTVWSALFVPLPLLALSLALEGPRIVPALTHISLTAVLSTLYTCILSTLVGFTVWNSLLSRYPTAAVAPFTLLVPVIGMSAAWWFLDEVPNAWEVTGGVLLLGGVAFAVINPRLRRRKQEAPEPALVKSA